MGGGEQGIVGDDDVKTYGHMAGGNFLYTIPVVEGKDPFFKGEQPIFM